MWVRLKIGEAYKKDTRRKGHHKHDPIYYVKYFPWLIRNCSKSSWVKLISGIER